MSFVKRFKKGGKVYLAEVESKRIGGKVVTRYIRYIGKEADGRTILSTSMSDVHIDQVKLYGPLLVLNHLAQEIGLVDHLGKFGPEILSMVYAHCLDYESINQMPAWFERTDLNILLNLEEVTEERLLDALDILQTQDPEILQRNIFNSVRDKYEIMPSLVGSEMCIRDRYYTAYNNKRQAFRYLRRLSRIRFYVGDMGRWVFLSLIHI